MEWNIKCGGENDCVFFSGFGLVRLAAEISDWWSEICQSPWSKCPDLTHRRVWDSLIAHKHSHKGIIHSEIRILSFLTLILFKFCVLFIFSGAQKENFEECSNLYFSFCHIMTWTIDQWPIWYLWSWENDKKKTEKDFLQMQVCFC